MSPRDDGEGQGMIGREGRAQRMVERAPGPMDGRKGAVRSSCAHVLGVECGHHTQGVVGRRVIHAMHELVWL